MNMRGKLSSGSETRRNSYLRRQKQNGREIWLIETIRIFCHHLHAAVSTVIISTLNTIEQYSAMDFLHSLTSASWSIFLDALCKVAVERPVHSAYLFLYKHINLIR